MMSARRTRDDIDRRRNDARPTSAHWQLACPLVSPSTSILRSAETSPYSANSRKHAAFRASRDAAVCFSLFNPETLYVAPFSLSSFFVSRLYPSFADRLRAHVCVSLLTLPFQPVSCIRAPRLFTYSLDVADARLPLYFFSFFFYHFLAPSASGEKSVNRSLKFRLSLRTFDVFFIFSFFLFSLLLFVSPSSSSVLSFDSLSLVVNLLSTRVMRVQPLEIAIFSQF